MVLRLLAVILLHVHEGGSESVCPQAEVTLGGPQRVYNNTKNTMQLFEVEIFQGFRQK